MLALLLGACRDSGGRDKQIDWQEGTPPPETLTALAPTVVPPATETLAPGLSTATEPTTAQDVAFEVAPTSTTMSLSDGSANGTLLSSSERMQLRPNEMGQIPILMYHEIVESGSTEDGYTRTVAEFRSDLQLLYDLGYYVVPLRDIVNNEIRAPVGKHPVALTFDDGTANHFRYLIESDGSAAIDPVSAVGILESFFADHPDFGRGGYFAVPPATCFDWQKAGAEPDQTPYCAEKLRWLLDHGYEVGNHTLNHGNLRDLDDQSFAAEVGGGWAGLTALVPGLEPNILAVPYGNYPDSDKHSKQRQMMRDGFSYEGMDISIAGALMVGADPAVSPVSTAWDPLYIARIRAYDGERGSTEWLNRLAQEPDQLYTSDGDPNTITIPAALPPALEGTFNRTRAETEGKIIVEYDPNTGDVV